MIVLWVWLACTPPPHGLPTEPAPRPNLPPGPPEPELPGADPGADVAAEVRARFQERVALRLAAGQLPPPPAPSGAQ